MSCAEFHASRSAFLFGDSTLPDFRGASVPSRLIRVRLARAPALRCDLAAAVVTPGSGSERNCLRNGLRVAYSRITLSRE
jgi:hypothetical protein